MPPLGCTQGPNSQGAAGAGWRPVVAGEAPQDVSRLRAGEEPHAEAVAGGAPAGGSSSGGALAHLDAPRAALVETEVAGLGVVDEDAVAGGREQPRDRVVGRVLARAEAPLGDDRLDQRATRSRW